MNHPNIIKKQLSKFRFNNQVNKFGKTKDHFLLEYAHLKPMLNVLL